MKDGKMIKLEFLESRKLEKRLYIEPILSAQLLHTVGAVCGHVVGNLADGGDLFGCGEVERLKDGEGAK